MYRKLRKIILLFALIGILGSKILAQLDQMVFSQLELNGALVSEIIQDDLGYLWFGTREGLFRFDGHRVEAMHLKFSEISKEIPYDILALKMGADGKIWIGSAEGILAYFDVQRDDFQSFKVPVNDTVSVTTIWGISHDEAGNIWLALERGLAFFDVKTKKFKTWRPTLTYPELRDNRYNVLYSINVDLEKKGLIWLGTRHGLLHFFPEKESFSKIAVPKKVSQESKAITQIFQKGEQFWFAASKSSALKYDRKKESWTFFNSGVSPPYSLRCLLPKSENEIWVGGVGVGLGLLNEDVKSYSFIQETNRTPQPGGTVESIFLDKSGTLWIGSEKGLFFKNPHRQNFNHFEFPVKKNTHSKTIYPHTFYQKKGDSIIYISPRNDNQLLALNRNSGDYKSIGRFPINVPNDRLWIHEVLVDEEGKIWYGTNQGVFCLDLVKQQLSYPSWVKDGLENKYSFHAMSLDLEGNIWALTYPKALVKLDLQDFKVLVFDFKDYTTVDFPFPDALNDLAIDSKGNVWVTAEPALAKFDPQSKTFETWLAKENCEDCPYSAWTFAIEIDQNDVVWLSYKNNGLDRFDPSQKKGNQFRHFGVSDGLPSNKVFRMELDFENNLWLGTGNGLSKLNPQNFEITNFSVKDGLRQNQFSGRAPVSLQTISTGEIVLGGNGYFTLLNPSDLDDMDDLTNLIFTGLEVFDKEKHFDKNLNYLNDIELSWKENFFTFSFAALDFVYTDDLVFQYRLEGFDREWRTTQEGQAQYTNVPSGEYVFRVKTLGKVEPNESNEIALGVKIVPPFWCSSWFYGLVSLLLGLVIFLAYKRRISNIREKEALKTAFNKKIMEVEMSALRAQMNPHFLFNSLNSIKNYIAKNDPRTASRYLTKFSQLMRLILSNSKTQTVTLANELKALELYIELESLRFRQKFEFEINISKEVASESIHIPPLILQPYVENAIWHGLMHKAEKGRLKIDIYKNGSTLFCEIEDNGIGREKAMEIKSKSAVRQKSMGLQITSERLQMVNELQGKKTKVEILDLKNDLGKGIGTKVQIEIAL